MISGKQILWGTLGWAFGGPIGGILGVIFAGSSGKSYKKIKQSIYLRRSSGGGHRTQKRVTFSRVRAITRACHGLSTQGASGPSLNERLCTRAATAQMTAWKILHVARKLQANLAEVGIIHHAATATHFLSISFAYFPSRRLRGRRWRRLHRASCRLR